MTQSDLQRLRSDLRGPRAAAFLESLVPKMSTGRLREQHGQFAAWRAAIDGLPLPSDAVVVADGDAVRVTGTICDVDRTAMSERLMALHPWRKGPFEIFGTLIDTEWRSCRKWDRIAPHVDYRGCRVLDVGCGNGYYGWRMLNAGARCVLGLDPFLLYVMQFEAIRRYAGADCAQVVLPLADDVLPERLEAFDVTVSMGVLYHRSSPIDHLQSLWHSLRPGGTLLLETLVVDAADSTVLMPEDRYAKMRNVWFIPSLRMLETWLTRCGFRNVRVVDVTRTTSEEQRRTAWMTFESLADFLDPADSTRTVEGYPGPIRAVVIADRS